MSEGIIPIISKSVLITVDKGIARSDRLA